MKEMTKKDRVCKTKQKEGSIAMVIPREANLVAKSINGDREGEKASWTRFRMRACVHAWGKGFLPPTSNSRVPAGSPRIQFNCATINPDTESDSTQVKASDSQDCPPLQMPGPGPGPGRSLCFSPNDYKLEVPTTRMPITSPGCFLCF